MAKHELVEPLENLPLRYKFHSKPEAVVPSHWHEDLEINYIYLGSRVGYFINGVEHKAKQGDVIVINSNEIHSAYQLFNKETKVITIIIKHEFLTKAITGYDKLLFNCYGRENIEKDKKNKYDLLTKHLDEFIFFTGEEKSIVKNLNLISIIYKILALLYKDFAFENKNKRVIGTEKYFERVKAIMNYIEINHAEDLTLDKLATKFNFSREYLARFFKKFTGDTIKNYITLVRLQHAYHSIINTDQSMSTISEASGFPNEKSFTNAFKKIYGMTPYQYKKHIKSQ